MDWCQHGTTVQQGTGVSSAGYTVVLPTGPAIEGAEKAIHCYRAKIRTTLTLRQSEDHSSALYVWDVLLICQPLADKDFSTFLYNRHKDDKLFLGKTYEQGRLASSTSSGTMANPRMTGIENHVTTLSARILSTSGQMVRRR